MSTSISTLQPGEAKRRGFDCSGLLPGHVVVTFGAGSGSSFTRRVEWGRYLAVSEGAQPSIIVEFVFIIIEIGELLKVESVAENGANATKALDELVTLRGAVGHKLERSTKVTVLLSKPFEHGTLINDFHLLASLLVHEEASVLFLLLGCVEDDFGAL